MLLCEGLGWGRRDAFDAPSSPYRRRCEGRRRCDDGRGCGGERWVEEVESLGRLQHGGLDGRVERNKLRSESGWYLHVILCMVVS